jgi:biotin transport system substrate-specific component
MTSLAPALPPRSESARRLVLADRVLPRHLVIDITLVVLGAALVGGFAQLYVPLEPVPITGQTLAVLLVGATLGAVRGSLSMIVYAVLGVVGVPWFSEQSSGWSVIVGASGGYIVGFIFAAFAIGWLSERKWDRQVLKALAIFAGGSLIVFAIGLPWLSFVLGTDLNTTLEYGLYPFILGGIIKAVIAAGLLPLAWWGANKLNADR